MVYLSASMDVIFLTLDSLTMDNLELVFKKGMTWILLSWWVYKIAWRKKDNGFYFKRLIYIHNMYKLPTGCKKWKYIGKNG